jgi:hypothetical protein
VLFQSLHVGSHHNHAHSASEGPHQHL